MISPMFYIKKALLSTQYGSQELKQLPQYKLKFLDLEKKYGIIDDYTYDTESTKILNAGKSESEIKCALLDIDLKYEKIDKLEWIKRTNDAKGKSWVAIKTNYDEENDEDNMEIEVVYNKTFIEHMRKKGLPGDTDEEIAEQWLKLFLIANLDEDDLALLNEEDEEEKKKSFVERKKIKGKTIIS